MKLLLVLSWCRQVGPISFPLAFVVISFFNQSPVSLYLCVTELVANTMAMGAATATTTNGETSPVDMPGRRFYTNGGVEEKNGGGASHHQKHQHSSSDDDDGPDDDSIHMAPSMTIVDVEFNSGTLQGLSKLRKNRQFCDVILQVWTILMNVVCFVFYFFVRTFGRCLECESQAFVDITWLPLLKCLFLDSVC